VQVARLVNQGDLLPDSMILEVCHSGKLSCHIFWFFKFGIFYVHCLMYIVQRTCEFDVGR